MVVSDCMAATDTLAFAHVKLPALAWGEKDGTVTNSERRISRQRPAFAAPGQARPDWRIVAGVAAAMGFGEGFAWRSPTAVFREHARLTAYQNTGERALNLEGLIELDRAGYDAMAPIQWPVRVDGSGSARLFDDGRFPTPDGRARMVPVAPAGPAEPTDGVYPLALNTGRVRDQWHTMTRTGLAAELCRHTPEPFVEIHPVDAAAAGIVDGALTRVITGSASAVALARVTDRQRPGALFMPMHWTDAFAPSGRANPLVAPRVDPVSGQPEFKHTPARVRTYGETWRGFFMARAAWDCPAGLELIWRRTPWPSCQLHEFAGRGDEVERRVLRGALVKGARGEMVGMDDVSAGAVREAYVLDGRLDRVLFITRAGRLPSRDWLADLFADSELSAADRASLLFGRGTGPALDAGPLVCACRSVGARKIEAAISGGATNVDAVGEATGAGASCGSCRPEILRLIRANKTEAVATREDEHVH